MIGQQMITEARVNKFSSRQHEVTWAAHESKHAHLHLSTVLMHVFRPLAALFDRFRLPH